MQIDRTFEIVAPRADKPRFRTKDIDRVRRVAKFGDRVNVVYRDKRKRLTSRPLMSSDFDLVNDRRLKTLLREWLSEVITLHVFPRAG